ncbi:uncharacterized protein LOC126006282 isoform X1 [Suncus etruscus]|uniref:uncharacterized protein LOC126006282 isoform X1 n=1 Tax=Suncus etruscus TaxID=109475 RepID=UPI002110E3EF|nr:uncharacterized protein LOC126006282 isoform X1 [Suncus etruscus]
MDLEILQLLLNDDGTWKKFMEEIELSSDKGVVLRECLRKHKILTAMEVKEMRQQKQKIRNATFVFLFILFLFCGYYGCTLANTFVIVVTCIFWMYIYHTFPSSEYTILRERSLNVFPEVKVKLGKLIAHLQEIIDEADQVHKKHTAVNMAASCFGMVSGMLVILAIYLAPGREDLSVVLSSAALGLEVLVITINVTNIMAQDTNMAFIEAKASDIWIYPEEGAIRISDNMFRLSSLLNIFTRFKHLWGDVNVKKKVTSGANLIAKISPFLGSVIWREFVIIVKIMSKRAYIMGGITVGFCVLMDAYNLVQASKQLNIGAKKEIIEKMRQWTQALERILEVVNQIHRSML